MLKKITPIISAVLVVLILFLTLNNIIVRAKGDLNVQVNNANTINAIVNNKINNTDIQNTYNLTNESYKLKYKSKTKNVYNTTNNYYEDNSKHIHADQVYVLAININEQKKKSEFQKACEKTKELSTYQSTIALAVDDIFDLIENPNGADFGDIGHNVNDVVESAINCVAACFGFGDVSKILLSNLTTFGEDPTADSMSILMDKINEQFEEVNENIDKVRADIKEVSTQIDNQTSEILDALNNALNAYFAKTMVIDFMSSSTGNFNYRRLKNYLFGDTEDNRDYRNAFYAILQDSILKNESEEEIKRNYDNLYLALMGPDQNGETMVNKFYDYIIGVPESGQESIQKYYYDYISSNFSFITDKDVSYEAVTFAQDLLNTCRTMQYVIKACHLYQEMQMRKAYGKLTENSYYELSNGMKVTLDDINKFDKLTEDINEQIKKVMAKDLCYFTGINESYFTEYNDGSIEQIDSLNWAVFGYIFDGQRVFLNQFPEYLADLFDLDIRKFRYETVNANGSIISDDDIIECEEFKFYNNIKVNLYYDDVKMCSIDFKINNPAGFAGGDGGEDNPFIINDIRQFELINEMKYGFDYSYKVVKELNFSNSQIQFPLGSEEKKYNGTFDGNWNVIKNINCTDTARCGLFYEIGSEGKVKNLIIQDALFEINANSGSSLNGGAIAAINNGEIENCTISNVTVSAKLVNKKNNENICSYIGGICGQNSGKITFCKVLNSTIKNDLEKQYSGKDDTKNQSNSYTGGLCGYAQKNSKVNYSFVDENTTFNVRSYNIANNSMDNAYLRINQNIGGLVGCLTEGVTLTGCCTKVKLENITRVADGDNIGKILSYKFTDYIYSHCDVDFIYSGISKVQAMEIVDSLIASENSIPFPVKPTAKVIGYHYYAEDDNTFEGFTVDQIYECGSKEFDVDTVVLTVDGEPVDCLVMGFYGFNTSNNGENKVIEVDVIAKLPIALGGYCVSTKIPIVILGNTPKELVCTTTSPIKVAYGSESITFSADLFGLKYTDGTIVNVSDKVTYDPINVNELGEKDLVVRYNSEIFTASITVKAVIKCIHNCYELQETHNPTCTSHGYSTYICPICGDIRNAYYVSPNGHRPLDAVKENEVVGTCLVEGEYDNVIYCQDCGEAISREHINTGYGHHHFENNELDDLYHICSLDNTRELHDYVTTVNGLKIIHTCSDPNCGHVYEELLSVNDIVNLPRMYVTNGFSLSGSHEVVLYVEIQRNPGISGADFVIEFDDRLEFVDYYRGTLLNSEPSCSQSGNKLYVVFNNANFADDGTVLKLVFRTPKDAKLNDEYEVRIGCSSEKELSEGMLIGNNNTNKSVLTYGGVISIVEDLPGDVDCDGTVDLLDAVLLARKLIHINDNNFNEKNADVNLSGITGVDDLQILVQYLAGGKGARVQANEYYLTLNYNDGVKSPERIKMRFYDDNGSINKWNIDPASRNGFKFIGWSSSLQYMQSNIIENGQNIKYDYDKIEQSLYAQYEENVIYLYSSANDTNPIIVKYNPNGEKTYKLDNPFVSKYTITLVKRVGTSDVSEDEKVDRSFLYWSTTPNGQKAYSAGDIINLENGEMGNVRLYAVWSSGTIDPTTINFIKASTGYTFSALKDNDGNTIWTSGSGNLTVSSDMTLNVKFNPINYYIEYNLNGGVLNGTYTMEDSYIVNGIGTRNIDNKTNLDASTTTTNVPKFYRTGYTFDGWVDKNGAKYADRAEVGYIPEDAGVATLTAVWTPNVYTITLDYQGVSTTGSQLTTTLYFKYGSGFYVGNANEEANKRTSITAPSWEGYIFSGFYTAEPINNHAVGTNSQGSYSLASLPNNAKQVIDTLGQIVASNTEFTSNTTLYAYWQPKIVTVAFWDVNVNPIYRRTCIEKNWKISNVLTESEVRKKGWVFNGWVDEYGYETSPNVQFFYDTDIYASYSPIVKERTITIRTNTEYTITDSGRFNQSCDTINLNNYFNISELITQGYSTFTITVTLSMKEVNAGYQHVFIYNTDSKSATDSNLLTSKQFEHGGSGSANTTYADSSFTATLSSSDVANGKICIRYGASGEDSDTWNNKNVRVTITFK